MKIQEWYEYCVSHEDDEGVETPARTLIDARATAMEFWNRGYKHICIFKAVPIPDPQPGVWPDYYWDFELIEEYPRERHS